MRNAYGVVRVSQVHGRSGDSFASPVQQRQRIEAECERQGLRLVDVAEELDVSGGSPLADRPGLVSIMDRIGKDDVLVAAYFDRLFRSLTVQAEIMENVEQRGASVLAVDVGHVSNGSAAQWLNATQHGMMAEYVRRQAKERSAEYQQRAIDRGVCPWPNIPPGYRRRDDGRLEPDPRHAGVVADAFRMRADGATVAAVREFLADHGIKRSQHGVTSMLASRVYLGEIHFGDYTPNLAAHPAIVDTDTWRRVQRARVSRGRRAKSQRLLARLGVLRCGSCGARMVVGTSHNSTYWLYRCPPNGDCERRVTISAEMVEEIVVGRVREALADAEGRASIEDNARQAELELARSQDHLARTIRTFVDAQVAAEPDAQETIAELREARDRAQERVDQLGHHPAAVTINAARDWDRLSLNARRALIRAVVARVLVAPGRGADRITVELQSE